MPEKRGWIRAQAARLVAAGLLLVLYGFSRLPDVSEAERRALASRFAFRAVELEGGGAAQRSLRAVHPSLERVVGWVSAFGAAVALTDLDGDGLSNDLCLVEPRSDEVLLQPVPGTGRRYPRLRLDPDPVPDPTAGWAPMGCLPGDLDEDGRIDLLVYYWGRPPVLFLQRPDDGGRAGSPDLQFVPSDVAQAQERWYTSAATLADVDGDGHADLVLGNYFPDGARILDAAAEGAETMQHSFSRAFNGGRNRVLLWRKGPAGGGETVSWQPAPDLFPDEVARGWTLAVGAADLDGDLLPELYFANDFGPDRLLHNRSAAGAPRFAPVEGRKRLTTPNSKVLGRDSFKGMGVDFGDVDGDGWLDIYVSNIAQEYALEESHFLWSSTGAPELFREGRAPYADASEPLGLSRSAWAWESRLADFDNDGVLEAIQATGFIRGSKNRWPELQELALANDELVRQPGSWPRFAAGDDLSGRVSNAFYVRSHSGRYVDLAPNVGLASSRVARGIATGDVDGDGDLDLVVANQWDDSVFYRNEGGDGGAALVLSLLLPVGEDAVGGARIAQLEPGSAVRGRPAIGAQAALRLADGRLLVGQVDGGNGHSGVRSAELHFGLGEATQTQQVEVELRWRDGTGQAQSRSLKLEAGRHILLLGGGPS